MSFLFAYQGSGPLIFWQILTGVVMFALLTGATNMINAYTDIEEDRVNNPIRVDWIRHLGLRNLRLSIIITYFLVLVLTLPFNLIVKLVVTIAVLDSIFYSLPPIRLKKHPLTALLSFSGAVGLPFLAGLAVTDSLTFGNPLFILFTYFMFTYGTVKNIPDYAGDQLAGLRTTATIFKNYERALRASTLLLLSPYLLITLFVFMSIIDVSYLLNIPFMAFPIYWAYKNGRAQCRDEVEQLYTYGFAYAVSFFLFNLLLSYPATTSVLIAISICLMISLITKLNIDSRAYFPMKSKYSLEDGDKFGFYRY